MKNEPTEAESATFQKNFTELTQKTEISFKFIMPILLLLVGLTLFGYVPFYIPFLFAIAMTLGFWTIIHHYIKCPRCQTSPLNRAGFEAQPFCQKCGLRIDNKKASRAQAVKKYQDKKAGEIAQTPLNASPANLDRYRLVETTKGDMCFKPTIWFQVLGSAFVLAGLGLAYMMVSDIPPTATLFSEEVLILLVPLLFTLAGFIIVYFAWEQRLFSLSDGVFKKGKEKPVLLIRIAALQLLSQKVSRNRNSPAYTNYQLNLVLHDKTRENVVSYANKDNALKDAERLASYLDVQLWTDVK